MSKRILLITPDKTRARKGVVQQLATGLTEGPLQPMTLMAPVELATLAALTPSDYDVRIWDEAIEGEIGADTDVGGHYDLVGVTGYLAHITRMLELAAEFKRRNTCTVAGGPAASNCPERFRGVFDVVFLGEAELTWPQFLREWDAGKHMNEYRQVQRPNLDQSPVPRWDLVTNLGSSYFTGGLQTTRGCPYDCEFCDVIHLFGRQPRHKPIANILTEMKNLHDLGCKQIFFCDDHFVADPRWTKELLREMVKLNLSFPKPMEFMTQLTINLGEDEEAMQLMAEANFWQMSIGIESPRKDSLLEVHKIQNTRLDMVQAVRAIQSHGMMVKSNIMLGFDHDDETIFDQVYDFVMAASIPYVNVFSLNSYPGTPQTARLLAEGRVLDLDVYVEYEGAYEVSNVVPKLMTRKQLMEGHIYLQEKLRAWDSVGARLKGWIDLASSRPPTEAQLRSAPQPDPNKMAMLQKYLSTLDEKARAVTLDCILYAQMKAPWAVGRIFRKLYLQRGAQGLVDRAKKMIHRQIELEASEEFRPRPKSAVQLPPNFKKVCKDEFVKTFHQLHAGMTDRSLMAEGLIRVWRDFVTKWGASFTQFEDYQLEHLRELCNKTIEQANNRMFANTRSFALTEDLTSGQIRRLSDEVMFAVEQDLKGSKPEDLVNLTIGPNDRASAQQKALSIP
jgi:radical SAM superfamily enzyme YgiQ (UPF0313 family)